MRERKREKGKVGIGATTMPIFPPDEKGGRGRAKISGRPCGVVNEDRRRRRRDRVCSSSSFNFVDAVLCTYSVAEVRAHPGCGYTVLCVCLVVSRRQNGRRGMDGGGKVDWRQSHWVTDWSPSCDDEGSKLACADVAKYQAITKSILFLLPSTTSDILHINNSSWPIGYARHVRWFKN